MKVVGIKKYDYEFKDGRTAAGRIVHCTSDNDSTMEGVAVQNFKLPDDKFGGVALDLGDDVFVSLNQYNKVTEFVRV